MPTRRSRNGSEDAAPECAGASCPTGYYVQETCEHGTHERWAPLPRNNRPCLTRPANRWLLGVSAYEQASPRPRALDRGQVPESQRSRVSLTPCIYCGKQPYLIPAEYPLWEITLPS